MSPYLGLFWDIIPNRIQKWHVSQKHWLAQKLHSLFVEESLSQSDTINDSGR